MGQAGGLRVLQPRFTVNEVHSGGFFFHVRSGGGLFLQVLEEVTTSNIQSTSEKKSFVCT